MIEFYIGLSSGLKSSLLVTLVLMISVSIIGLRVKKMSVVQKPGTITLFSIMFVEAVNGMMADLFKKYWKQFTPYMLTILLFLVFANTVALFGLTTPLSNISVALGFSLLAFGSIQIAALVIRKPLQRSKDLLEPLPLFLPINLIGEMSTPFAMGIRLFGNLLSGSIISIIIYGITSYFGIIFGAFILHPVFDIFFGIIQAYVYFMLFSIFLSMAVED